MSLNRSAADELTAYAPADRQQGALRADFLTHLTTHRNAWARECRPDHLTASAIVLEPTGRHVLLALHAKVGLWLQFGGHIEPQDSSVADAALREAVEESGIDQIELFSTTPIQLDRHAAPCAPEARHHLDVQFLALADGGRTPVVSAESVDVRWFPVDALPEETDDAVRSLVTRATQYLAANR